MVMTADEDNDGLGDAVYLLRLPSVLLLCVISALLSGLASAFGFTYSHI